MANQLALVGIPDLAGDPKILKRDYVENRANKRDYFSYLYNLLVASKECK